MGTLSVSHRVIRKLKFQGRSINNNINLRGVNTSKHKCLCMCFIRLTTCFGNCGPSLGHKNIYRGKTIRCKINSCGTYIYIYQYIYIYIYTYTECPTTYQTRQFFNNFTTNEDIATKFEADLTDCVRNVTAS